MTTTTKSATKNSKGTKPSKNSKATKPAAEPRARKEGLRKPQVRMLQALSKSKGALNRHRLNQLAGVDIAYVAEFAGKLDPIKRAHCDETYTKCPSLVALGLAKVKSIKPLGDEGREETVWEITPKGRQALAKALADAK